ncbi:hypothetical protein KVV02_007181 [Mortierella alpina]|uniref:Kelch repeat-containing protein n=1 Tax=Mortierella alpina TaxID=64518 RepID=A0A9P8CW12_MORAP|nr:hypothetical protein KVV02_007181 [Mortierella alpina]
MGLFTHHPSKRGRAPSASLLLSLLPLFLAPALFTPPSSHLASAQVPNSPLSVSAPAVARTATKLYIAGGNHTNSLLSQFYSLDLAVPWNETQPAWTRLADGPKQELFPAVFSADDKTLITFHSGTLFAMRYSVDTNTWTSATCRPAVNFQGVGAVTDPNTGRAYLAAGYTGRRDTMSVYNFVTDKLVSLPGGLPVAEGLFRARAYYGNAWCKYRNSILYFGGYDTALNPIVPENVVTEYQPATNAWSTMMTSGVPPPMRADHCMTANDDGTKIVIYGGRLSATMGFLNDLYILDTVTQTWRQGVSGPTRVYAACTVAGNQLLLWGGLDEAKNRVDATVHVYNLDLDTWGSSYTPPASYLDSAKRPPPHAGEGERGADGQMSSGSHVAAIVGGVVGVLAVILATLLFVFFRRKRGNGRPRGARLVETREIEESQGMGRNNELQHLRVQLENQQEELELHRRLLQLQQQQQEQQQQMQQMQQRQQHGRPLSAFGQQLPVAFAPVTAGPSDPYRVVGYAYTGDSKAPAMMSAAAEPSSSPSSMGYHHLPNSTPSSPIYAAHPYQPIPHSPSPGPSVPISAVSATSSAYNSLHNSAAPSRVNSLHAGGLNQDITNSPGQGGVGSQRDQPKPSGPRGNPQHGARER